MHTPVLLKEAVDSLDVYQGGKYIDATLGEGGHLQEIARRGGIVLGIDWDRTQVERLKDKLHIDNLNLVTGNYANIEQIASEADFTPVDGVLFDLGLSMEQLSSSKRGFSYKQLNDPLDMRIGSDKVETAADILNYYNAEALYELFAKYSEELDSKHIAEVITEQRIKKRLETVGDLVEIVELALKTCRNKHQHDKLRTLSRIFQALRIVVNSEFENIRKGLQEAVRITKKGGKVAIITFHSLEDRVAKQFIRINGLKSQEIVKGKKDLSYERSATLRVITV